MQIDLAIRALSILGGILFLYASVWAFRYVARRYWKPIIAEELEDDEFTEEEPSEPN